MPQSQTFLLVDDDIDDTFLFREVLSDVAPQVTLRTAANGQEAIESLLAPSHPLPQLIFLDLNMPKMDGKQCLLAIKRNERLQHIPVIMYTTSSHSRDIEETMQNGAISFITKPSHISELRTILSSLANNTNNNLEKTLRHLSQSQNTFIVC
ncbi:MULTISPECIES: response regulator [Chitinophagaceae]|uniref:response regulator n=1 Tax=Chitinophagaceae TaxID=563835 RepID=UPI000DEF6D7C|nr:MULTISPECIES: response regulator [Chitinophagaceae]RPD47374.1 response regulator [Paracnuella aquatica]